MAQQREWYEGQVVANSVIDGTRLLSIKFSNGAILHNVRPDELRRVPSTTVMGWLYTMQFVVLCGFAIAFHLYSIVHDLLQNHKEQVEAYAQETTFQTCCFSLFC